MGATITSNSNSKLVTSQEEQPERRIQSAPGAMRNPKRVSHKAKLLLNSKAKIFINQLSLDYPDFHFRAGGQEHWSPKTQTITYRLDQDLQQLYYGVLHELAHAILGHTTYQGDFELLKLEAHAWELAAGIAKKYEVELDPEHVQVCLDTYRDWLHRRSTCPTCGTHVLQKDAATYQCFNCQTVWRVSSGRFVRPYRKMMKSK